MPAICPWSGIQPAGPFSFAADPHGGPETLWFCFRLRHEDKAAGPLGKVRLVLKHIENMLGARAPERIWPVARQADGDWFRLPPGQPDALPDGRCRATWTVDVTSSYVDIAACYPYGMPEVETLARDTAGYWQIDTIGVSQAGRPLVRLSNAPGAVDSDRPGLYLIARQHSAETPGSWVLDGVLRECAFIGDKAPLIWAVPLTNIDGIEQGDYGKDNFPYDLNRAWGGPPMRHEVQVFQADIQRWRKRCRPVLGIDFHAPGLCEAEGCYAYLPNPRPWQAISEASRQWAEWIAESLTADYAAPSFPRVINYASRWETPSFSSYMASLGICCLSPETPYGATAKGLLAPEDYRHIGQRFCRCLMEHLGT